MSDADRGGCDSPGPTLFPVGGAGSGRSAGTGGVQSERAVRARGSALWAAYGDALGFISELTDEAGLRRRTDGAELRFPVPWRRRIGGRTGTTALLPAGCYSDDTQLRLSTARSIGPRGFDVEAFAKVELPVWLAYALGGGRASKKAARNLAKATSPWFSNTYQGWTEAGGNGAAMRIQPHVWSAPDLDDPSGYLLGVVRNAVCTHGHPVALLGAVVHALCLARSMAAGTVPDPSTLGKLILDAGVVPSLLRRDPELGELWLGSWERVTGRSFDDEWQETVVLGAEAAKAADTAATNRGPDGYKAVLARLHLLDPETRGSGLLTAIASVALTWCDDRPVEALAVAANAIGSDTDTIATMAGALLGAVGITDPPVEVLDAKLIADEADRMTSVANGVPVAGHRYPDLLSWSAPRTQADALVSDADGLHVTGLGRVARTVGDVFPAVQGEFAWQWVRLELGQLLLIKRRTDLPMVHHEPPAREENRGHVLPEHRSMTVTDRSRGQRVPAGGRTQAPDERGTAPLGPGPGDQPARTLDLERVLWYLEREHMSDQAIGYALRRVAREGSTGQLLAFLAAVLDKLRQ